MSFIHVAVLHQYVLVDTLSLGIGVASVLVSDVLEGVDTGLAVRLVDCVDLAIEGTTLSDNERVVLILVLYVYFVLLVELLEVVRQGDFVVEIFSALFTLVSLEEIGRAHV